MLVPSYLLHGLGALANGFAPGPTSLLLVRIGTGLAQSGFYAPHMAIAAAAMPPDGRAFGTTVMTSGFGFGLAAGSAVAGFLLYRLGLSWRVPFWLFGSLTVAVALLMERLVPPDPPREERPAPAPTSTPAPGRVPTVRPGGGAPGGGRLPFALWLLVHHLTMYGMYVVLSWLPFYLQTERGIPGDEAAAAFALLPVLSLPAGLVLSRASDRGGGRKRILLWLAPLGALALFGLARFPGRTGLYGSLVLYAVGGKIVFDPLMMAWLADLTPPARYSQAFAIANFAVTAAMVVAPALAGFIRQWSGSFAGAFYVVAALQLVAWIASRRGSARRAARARRPGRRTGASSRPSPGTSRVPCRRR